MEVKSNARRTITGVVVSNKMNKTATVQAQRTVRHAKYQKFVKRHVKYHVHDENNTCLPGDVVTIVECRPMSKLKRWRLGKIVERAE